MLNALGQPDTLLLVGGTSDIAAGIAGAGGVWPMVDMS